jgi:ABC-type polysaccharide/polyol phosphate export permease
MSHKTTVCLVYHLANFKLNLIEFGITFIFLVIFVALLAIAEDIVGQWSTLVYLGAFIVFSVAICLFGLKLAPHMYDQYS